MATELIAKNGQLPYLQINKETDQHTQIFQRTIVIKNYKLCAGTVSSTLTLPEAFCEPKDETKTLICTIIRSKFPSRPMEIILDGIRNHWTYKCVICRSQDETDDLEFAEIKFVRANGGGNASQVSGLFKDQLRDDLFMKLTITISNPIDEIATSSKIVPQPAQIGKLFMKESSADFQILCSFPNEEERNFPVHKAILSTASPFFRAMFQPETAESKNGVVTLTTIPHKALYEVLYCIYHGERSSSFGQSALDVMVAADFFEMLTLRDYAACYLLRNFNKENVFKVIQSSLQLNLNNLTKKACEFVKFNVPDDEAKLKLTELQKQCPELMVFLIQLM